MKSVFSSAIDWVKSLDVYAKGRKMLPGYVIFSLFLGMLVWSLCFELDRIDMNVWDESLFSLRALHLYEKGDFLQNFNQYQGLYDHPSTKLPFITILQSAAFAILGPSVWSLRIVVSILMLYTSILLSVRLHDLGLGRYTGILSALILFSSPRFLGEHMSRTGDHDAPLAMFLLLASLYFYGYLSKGGLKYLGGMVFWLLAGLLTKNVFAGLIVPGWVLFSLFSGNFIKIFQDKKIYIAAVLTLLLFGGFLLFFEWRNSGFLEQMWNYELMGRYTNVIEGHTGPWYYYVLLLVNSDLSIYIWVWVLSIIYTSLYERDLLKSMYGLLLSCTVTFLIFISLSLTKLPWYHAVIFPLIALQIALFILKIISELKINWIKSKRIVSILKYSIGLLIVLGWLINSNEVHNKNMLWGQHGFVEAHRRLKDNGLLEKQNVILEDDFGTDTYFYCKTFTDLHQGVSFTFQRNIDSIRKGQSILVNKPWLLRRLQSKFRLHELAKFDQIHYLRVED